MKYLPLLIPIMFFCVAMSPIVSKLSERSKEQYVIVSNNAYTLKSEISAQYSKGFRVISIIGQSVSTSVAIDNHNPWIMQDFKKGDIIVVMEK